MNECMTVLPDVTGHSHAAPIGQLNTEAVLEDRIINVGLIDVSVFRQQACGEVRQTRTFSGFDAIGRDEEIPHEIARHMRPGLMVCKKF